MMECAGKGLVKVGATKTKKGGTGTDDAGPTPRELVCDLESKATYLLHS